MEEKKKTSLSPCMCKWVQSFQTCACGYTPALHVLTNVNQYWGGGIEVQSTLTKYTDVMPKLASPFKVVNLGVSSGTSSI